MRRKVIWLTFWVTMIFWFGQGCGGPSELNESNVVRGVGIPPAVAHNEPIQFEGERSVFSLDRSDWPHTEVPLARQVTQTRPVFWQSRLRGDEHDPRETGAYPTIESALYVGQEEPEDIQAQIYEAVWDPVAQALNLALAPVRLVSISRPTTVRHSPLSYYALLPSNNVVALYPGEAPIGAADRDDRRIVTRGSGWMKLDEGVVQPPPITETDAPDPSGR